MILITVYSLPNTVNGTRSHHSFIPTSCFNIKMRMISSDEIFSNVSTTSAANFCDISEFQLGKYIACHYDDRWYIWTIVECSTENDNVKV